jgi:hypothetical protein
MDGGGSAAEVAAASSNAARIEFAMLMDITSS